MKKWLKQSLLLCLLAVLLSSSVFAADTESGICDLNSHNGYQLTAVGTPVTVDGKRVYPGTQTLSLTCDNPAAGENLLLVQTDEGVPLEENLVYIDQKTGSADFEIYPSSLADGVTYYVYVSNDTGKTLAGTFSYYDPFPYTVTGAYAASKKNKGKYTFTVTPIEGAQYRMDDGAWQDSNVFDGIEFDTEHVFYVQVDGRVGQSEPLLCRDAAKEAAKVDAIIKKLPAAKKVKLENEAAIRDAKNIYDALPEEGRYCLTTLLCARDRKRQISEIRERLARGLACRVVSTSLIEAGVDVDFPVAYREDCGLDSLLQTAGRCNREGKRRADESLVYRFSLSGKNLPAMLLKNLSALQYAARKHTDLSSPEAIYAYFEELLRLKGADALDKRGILEATEHGIDGCMLPFAQIAGRFHLIEAPTRTIYLPIGDGAPLCERLQRGEVSRTLLRKLGQFSVACYEPQFRALDDAGALELLPDGSAILMDLSNYDEKTGLAMNVETGVGIFI